ncbi:hypothetical protein HMPREF1632_03440 [Mageeibacillus indolicus 0009-5]|nr:hypothetical protein HMPREF1632_03440 [Mageeibacillus indolicus 0009-5]
MNGLLTLIKIKINEWTCNEWACKAEKIIYHSGQFCMLGGLYRLNGDQHAENEHAENGHAEIEHAEIESKENT